MLVWERPAERSGGLLRGASKRESEELVSRADCPAQALVERTRTRPISLASEGGGLMSEAINLGNLT